MSFLVPDHMSVDGGTLSVMGASFIQGSGYDCLLNGTLRVSGFIVTLKMTIDSITYIQVRDQVSNTQVTSRKYQCRDLFQWGEVLYKSIGTQYLQFIFLFEFSDEISGCSAGTNCDTCVIQSPYCGWCFDSWTCGQIGNCTNWNSEECPSEFSSEFSDMKGLHSVYPNFAELWGGVTTYINGTFFNLGNSIECSFSGVKRPGKKDNFFALTFP